MSLALSIVLLTLAPTRPISEAETVLAIYIENWSLESAGETELILAAWEDGQILWSEDSLAGGAPYRSATIDPDELTRLLSELEGDGLFELEELGRARFGPDAVHTTMLLRWKGKELRMRSWHERMEARGAIAKNTGVFSSDEPRLTALSEEPSDYLFYRFVWAEIRSRASALIPGAGQTAQGEIVRREGALSWEEEAKRP